MNQFQISNSVSALVLGIYEAENEAAALELFAQQAGYASYADAEAVAPSKDGEIVVDDVTDDIEFVADWCMDGAEKNNLYNSAFYHGWDGSQLRETYADFSEWDIDDLTEDQRRIHELQDGNPAFVDAVNSRLIEMLEKAISDEVAGIKKAVLEASDDYDLQQALEVAHAYAAYTFTSVSDLYDATKLPVFGGEAE